MGQRPRRCRRRVGSETGAAADGAVSERGHPAADLRRDLSGRDVRAGRPGDDVPSRAAAVTATAGAEVLACRRADVLGAEVLGCRRCWGAGAEGAEVPTTSCPSALAHARAHALTT